MKSFPPAQIRNVALVGHGGAGKTSLAEALLFCSGAISRQGRVEDGNTTTDFDPEEVKRGISLALSLAPFEFEGHKINLLDAPGYADFVTDLQAALDVADLAVIVVSAVEGVEVQTEAAWRLAAERGLPRMFFVNKLDRERASFDRTLEQLRDKFGAGVAPLELPIGEESEFRGIADLLTDSAVFYEGGKATKGEIPDEMTEREHEVRDNLVEGIVVADDDLTERYLEGEDISAAELEKALAQGVADGQRLPRHLRVGHQGDRHRPPGPAHLRGRPLAARPPAGDWCRRATAPPRSTPDPAGQPLALVYRTIADPYVGKVSFLKVLSGTIRPDVVLTNPRTHSDERLHGLFTMRGKEQEQVQYLPAGDLGAVSKLSDTSTGDTLAPKGTPVTVPAPEPPVPVLSVAILPKSKGDEDKLMTGLHRLQDEDRALFIRRDDETHQTILSGMGETHLSIVTERLARKFGVEVQTEDVKVAYRETITGHAEAEGKYKKQTGGHGQFGVAFLRVEPLERGGGFEFVDKIVGGADPPPVHPRGREGRGRDHGDGRRVRLPGGRRAGHRLRRQVPPRRLVGDELQDGGVARVQGGHGQGRAGAARAHLAAGGHRPRPVPGRRHGRPQLPPGTGAGHRGGRQRRADDHRPGAHVGDPALRHRPALHHRRAGTVHRRPRPLRPPARPPGRQGGQARVTSDLPPCEECGFVYTDLAAADAPAAIRGLRPPLPGAPDPLPPG